MEARLAITPGPDSAPTLGRDAATFRSARKLSVHRWFPWIEGFSEDIPLHALRTHRPELVYDPFMGSGTTAVTSVLRNIDAAGAEVNPFLRFVVLTKTESARALSGASAAEIIAAASAVAAEAREMTTPSNIGAAFVESDYFSPEALSWISRLKAAIDSCAIPHPEVRNVFRLALASTLVGASNMTRRTDLRRRRGNETPATAEQLPLLFERACWAIASDLAHLPPDIGELRLLSHDARHLHRSLRRAVDVCVTSPPYLNGTNYARNTKLELWILDFIHAATDLASLHRAAISAGINSARADEITATGDRELDGLLDSLRQDAYDPRLVPMVAGYFADMSKALRAVSESLRPGGHFYLDIGDSKFAGVHVPTDTILARHAAHEGLVLRHQVQLRARRSKDGSPLRQMLLVFQSPAVRRQPQPSEPERLRALVRSRAFQQPPYGARNWGHKWHSMCSYQAKLKPSIAHFLVKEFSAPGDVVLDPFAGSGAVPLEANLQGRRGWGNDINPLALHLLRAKAERPDPDAIWWVAEDLLAEIASPGGASDVSSLGSFGFNGPLVDYYHPETLREILAARRWFASAPATPAVSFVASAFAHILHGNRPYALSRRSHPITPFAPTGPTERRAVEPRLRSKLERLLAADLPPQWRDGWTTAVDATKLPDNPAADVVITSPPFFGSTRFHVNNWIRLWFCGWEPADFDTLKEDFVEMQQGRSFEVYSRVFESLHSVLRPGGLAVWHLGLSKRKDMGAELTALAPPHFEVVALETESVEHCQSHGVSSQGITVAHQFLLLRSV